MFLSKAKPQYIHETHLGPGFNYSSSNALSTHRFLVPFLRKCWPAMVGMSEDARERAVTQAFAISGWDAGMLLAGLRALYIEPRTVMSLKDVLKNRS